MIYQLPNGKCVEMSVEQYFRMSDDDFKNLIATNSGEEINDPFAGSVLRKGSPEQKGDDITEIDLEELSEEELEELGEIIDDDYFDNDFIDYDNLET
jgi:hypothetical protein